MEIENRPGDIALDHTYDWATINVLVNLKNGRIVPAVGDNRWFNYLYTQPFIPDIVFHFNRILIPRLSIDHGILHKLDLAKEKIIVDTRGRFSNLYDKWDNLEKILRDECRTDPRNLLAEAIGEVHAFKNLEKIGLASENESFDEPWFGGAEKIARWMEQIDLKSCYYKIHLTKIPADFKASTIAQSLYSDTPVFNPGFHAPFLIVSNKLLEEIEQKRIRELRQRHISAFEILRERFNLAKQQIYSESLALSKTISVELPLSIPVILYDIKDGRGPQDFYDVMLEKRNEFSKLRNWLTKFDAAIQKDNHKEIFKFESEIELVVEELIREYGVNLRVKNKIKVYPEILRTILNPKKFITKKLDEFIGSELVKIAYPHRWYLKELGEGSIISLKELKQEIIRCFPIQGKQFFDTLYYYLIFEKKCNEIASFPRIIPGNTL